MARRTRKREPASTRSPKRTWDKYGTWITSAVTVVLAVTLVTTLVQRRRRGRLRKGEFELSEVAREDPGAVMHLKRLELEYGDTELADRIQLGLAQALLRDERYDEAESRFRRLLENDSLLPLFRAEAHLGMAYVAQEKGDLALARERYEKVEEDKVYASEARRMFKVLDKLEKQGRLEEGEKEAGETEK